MNNCFRVNSVRKHYYKENVCVIQGCYINGDSSAENLYVCFDDKEVKADIKVNNDFFVKQRYLHLGGKVTTECFLEVELPKNIENYKKFKVFAKEDDEIQTAIELEIEAFMAVMKRLEYSLDTIEKKTGEYEIKGWVVTEEKPKIKIVGKNGVEEEISVNYHYRKDLMVIYPELVGEDKNKEFGYSIKIKAANIQNVKFVIEADGKTIERELTEADVSIDNRKLSRVQRFIRYYKKNGMKKTVKKVISKAKVKFSGQPTIAGTMKYEEWVEKTKLTSKEIEEQKAYKFELTPKFSIVIPLYNTPIKYLRELIECIQNQTYGNFEICFADGSPDNVKIKPVIDEYIRKDNRIKYMFIGENLGIAGNTNKALDMATGDYIILADHDDLLPLNALFECAKAINEDKTIDVIYTDEDKIDMDGKKRFQPHFKPDFNIDLLCSVNYICHMFVVKKSVVEKVGHFRSEFDGAQDYDFILRCIENAENIYHIPKILYHWRSHINSTAGNPESKLYAFEAGKKAIKEHYKRIGIDVDVEDGPSYGLYHTIFKYKETPLISIIIPNKDHTEDLDKCIMSIINKSEYRNFEFVIIENNSTEEKTFKYYEEIQQKYDNVKVVYWKDEFNYSAINNFGVEYANGEYLLFLNNDTEIINETCLEEMLHYCMREDVGIVGARLYYEDDTIQHAGVVIGYGGIAGHTFIGQGRYDLGYFARAMIAQDYSAVTAACMMSKKSLFKQVGGFTEKLKVAFNDIDYCMKIRKIGKLVVYNPYAELYHYESKSRGLEDTPEKVERFNGEILTFRERWPEILEKGDPYYNPNLSLDRSDFALKEI